MKAKIQRCFCVFIGLVMLLSALPLSGMAKINFFSIISSAADFDEVLTFARINGKMAVKACMKTFEGSIEIPSEHNGEPVEIISTDAFRECSGLTEIIIPDSVISIGRTAFLYCTSLKDITFSENLTSIGDEAFEHCGITEITIPPRIESIGDRVFQGCSNLVTEIFTTI